MKPLVGAVVVACIAFAVSWYLRVEEPTAIPFSPSAKAAFETEATCVPELNKSERFFACAGTWYHASYAVNGSGSELDAATITIAKLPPDVAVETWRRLTKEILAADDFAEIERRLAGEPFAKGEYVSWRSPHGYFIAVVDRGDKFELEMSPHDLAELEEQLQQMVDGT